MGTLVFERDINVVEQHVLSAITERYACAMLAAKQGSMDFRAGDEHESLAPVSSWATCGEARKAPPCIREGTEVLSCGRVRKLSPSTASTIDYTGSSTEDDGESDGSNVSPDRVGAGSRGTPGLDSPVTVLVRPCMDEEEDSMSQYTECSQVPAHCPVSTRSEFTESWSQGSSISIATVPSPRASIG